jgi:hypothetical protein
LESIVVTTAKQWSCDTCGKPVNRIFGMVGAAELPDGRSRILNVARGYCFEHRDAVPEMFRAELAAVGERYLLLEPFVDLRPRDVDGFLRTSAVALGSPQQGHRDDSGAFLCPHCDARVNWDEGPHLEDARALDGTVAWSCHSCGSAGLAYLPSGE